MARATTAQTLTFTIATGGTWKARVSQIECSNPSRAESDCFQYFTGFSGRVMSFNFGNSRPLIENQQYSICVRQEEGYCGIEWSPTQGVTPDAYELSTIAYKIVSTDTIKINHSKYFICMY